MAESQKDIGKATQKINQDSAQKEPTTVVKPKAEKPEKIRVIQRNGKILVGEDFTPLAETIAEPKRANTSQGVRTRTQLMERRRTESIQHM